MTINSPWLSVIMPTRNGSPFLRTALNSLTAQQGNDFEIIAVDDGSVDDTLNILDSFTGKLPLNIVRLQHTGNWVANTNFGISIAKGQYISFLHQDDIWLPNRLICLKYLINKFNNINFFWHSSYFIDSQGRNVGIWKSPLPENQDILLPKDVFFKLLVQNFIAVNAPCFSRKIAKKIGFMDENLWYTADWDLWLRFIYSGPSLYYPNPLSGFRVHPSSQTASKAADLTEFMYQMQIVIDKYLPLLTDKINDVKPMAEFSVTFNTALAAVLWKKQFDLKKLIQQFINMNLTEKYQYVKYSKIIERCFARIRSRLFWVNK